ncbi:glycosyltransferase family 2 protein, partial [Rodentibacter caecimuris]|uniref:glycosyltransferase family 2 protein n=1 Tax=Rodentibacter caecimuris TaxID=1796644 RepID=UPI000987D62B
IDHGSTDNTREILQLLKEEGLPVYIYYYNELAFNPVPILNNVMRLLLEKDSLIDYIFPLDTDEFVYCPSRIRLESLLDFIPDDRVGMYTWRGYIPNTTEYNPNFLTSFTEQRQENILTPKVIIPRKIAEQHKLTIGSHFMVNEANEEIKSIVFCSSQYRHFYTWFIQKFNAEFIETDDLWLGHYPIRSANQQIKKVLEKSITMAIKFSGGDDVAWENQLKDLLNNNMIISLERLRLIAYQYRADNIEPIQVFHQQALRTERLTFKYLHLVEDSPLPTVARLILELANKLRK